MSARNDILNIIRARKGPGLPRPAAYRRQMAGDTVERFVASACAANATVERLGNLTDVPERVARLLRERNLPATVHVPDGSELVELAWGSVSVSNDAPGPEDTAVSVAPFGVGESGTLVFPSGKGRPASWHFRPGFEIAILREEDVVSDLESVFAMLHANWPPTLNLVTGPSRTADIEQTLELGAHGPKAVAILLIRARPAD
ncbi:MAG TPA: LUD domain-containing protein [Rhizomicrobium sp.]|nr:LUD domain-containing protein [Rhizomicrobium sp.]